MKQNYLEEYIPVDLHVHTPASDCYNRQYDSIEDEYINLVKMYVEKGVKVIAITDHNSIKGYKELMRIKLEAENRIKYCLKGQTLIQNKPFVSEGYFSASLEKALFSAVSLDYLYFLVSSCRFDFSGNGRDFCHGDFVAWADAHPLSG